MLEEIYNLRRELIDEVIKNLIKKVKEKLVEIDGMKLDKNKELINKIEENCNIKLGIISKEVYLQGVQDGINFILEAREKWK